MFLLPISTIAKLASTVTLLAFLVACSDSVDKTQSSEPFKHDKDVLTVWKSPDCACCERWVQHLKSHGLTVNAVNTTNVSQKKAQIGIPENLQSCHTAISESGYVFEGHVPARFISRFISEADPEGIGLAVAGMPTGSPGMENGAAFTPYSITQLNRGGVILQYAAIDHPEEQEE